MKILTIIGARPQFIKASVVSKAILETPGLEEVILHTGQHYDPNMSDLFFDQLGIPKPNYQLDINGGTHGDMTGKMLIEIEKVLLSEKPDIVLVYGDTNSTLSGALAAAKLHIPVAHVEAGLRSFNMEMPEEINRILTDQISSILFCPTQTAMDNLKKEGFQHKPITILNVGDVMQDSALLFAEKAVAPTDIPIQKDFILATLHRAENTDNPERLASIVSALNYIHINIMPVVMPLHPRTKNLLQKNNLSLNVNIIEPVGYLEMLWLLKQTDLVLTDSGGVQKEAFFFQKPCITMRDQTEWVELIEVGANKLVGADTDKIITTVKESLEQKIIDKHQLYGGGQASQRITKELSKFLNK